MPLSKEEREQLDALMAKDQEPEAEEDFEVVIQDPDGRTVHLPYSKARNLLKKWGFDLDEELPVEPGAEGGEEGDEEVPPEIAPKGKGYWKQKGA